MKRILITGGPTNEYIDEVMKITNMSSGKVAVELASHFSENGDFVTLLITKTVKSPLLDVLVHKPNVRIIRFETTAELLEAIQSCQEMQFDIIVHSAAVADYKPEFSFRAEDMADELSRVISEMSTKDNLYDVIFQTLTNPECKVNDDTKISSVEPNLTVKLGLTPKIIASLRDMFPNAFICGFKLLENVPEEELIGAAMKQIAKCKTDMCFANDLAELRKGNAARLVVTPNGYHNVKVNGAYGIYNLIKIAME